MCIPSNSDFQYDHVFTFQYFLSKSLPIAVVGKYVNSLKTTSKFYPRNIQLGYVHINTQVLEYKNVLELKNLREIFFIYPVL